MGKTKILSYQTQLKLEKKDFTKFREKKEKRQQIPLKAFNRFQKYGIYWMKIFLQRKLSLAMSLADTLSLRVYSKNG